MAEMDVAVADTVPAAAFEDLSAPAETSTELATTTDGTVQKVKKTKIIKRKRRPARPQQDPATFKSEPPPQTGTMFNIWYNKWSGGDREDAFSSKHQAKAAVTSQQTAATPEPTKCQEATSASSSREDYAH
ncbi:Pre-mRNA-splicing factor [Meristemomyces frigidus]|uniref:Pre-mRNA-splicing factor n=1 Tax=Meristemomyces frigidus TaxID=1508187 RepID=A0AAN7YAT6_9PEZI|nr:Pre-mRNA-splicing factor [Meristemomyces frigidus]